MLRDGDFAFLQRLLKERSGLALTPDKAYLVVTRLRPVMEDHGFGSIAALVQHLRLGRRDEILDQVIDAMTTNESLWFRDGSPFEALVKLMLPNLLKGRTRAKPLRVWCAAASTGQEPYSIAITLEANASKLQGQNVEIIGTDLSTAALSRARMGVYTSFEIGRGMPKEYLQRYFRTDDRNRYTLAPEIRSKVRFESRNLLDSFSGLGTFDIIFCRNVLIYFDRPTKADVLDRMAEILAPSGYLVLGGPETTLGLTDAFKRQDAWKNVYVRTVGDGMSKGRHELVA